MYFLLDRTEWLSVVLSGHQALSCWRREQAGVLRSMQFGSQVTRPKEAAGDDRTCRALEEALGVEAIRRVLEAPVYRSALYVNVS